MIADLLVGCIILCLGAAFVVYVKFLRERAETPPRIAALLSYAALALMIADFALLSGMGRPLLDSMRDSILFFALILMLVNLAATRLTHSSLSSVFVLPLVIALVLVSAFFDRWFPSGEGQLLVSKTFLLFHILLFLVSYAFFMMAAAFGIMFLLMDKLLKRHEFRPIFFKMPGLVKIDTFGYRCILLGLLLLSAAMGIAFTSLTEVAARAVGSSTARDLSRDFTVIATIILWTYYSVTLFLRLRLGWIGKRASYMAVLGMVLVISFYFLGKVLSAGKPHGFNQEVAASVRPR